MLSLFPIYLKLVYVIDVDRLAPHAVIDSSSVR